MVRRWHSLYALTTASWDNNKSGCSTSRAFLGVLFQWTTCELTAYGNSSLGANKKQEFRLVFLDQSTGLNSVLWDPHAQVKAVFMQAPHAVSTTIASS